MLVTPALADGNDAKGAPELQQVLEQNRAQLRQLQALTTQASDQIAVLRRRLAEAEQRNQAQLERIGTLQRQLTEVSAASADVRDQWRRRVIDALAARLSDGPVTRIEGDRLIIATDPVFVFGTGELGAEGRDRLQPLARALTEALQQLPPTLDWRLAVAGHTDRRPLRDNARFASNWELSAARAVAVLRYLNEQGLASPRLAAVAYGASEPADTAISKAAHRRNRRVELRLLFPGEAAGAN